MAANFRTFGWFGSDCRFGTFFDGDLEMYDFATQTVSSKFPLDIAMKIFWEAQTINIEAYKGPNLSFPEFTISMDVQWGENRIIDIIDGVETIREEARPFLTTAKQAVCILNGTTFERLTFKRINYNYGGRRGSLVFEVLREYYGRSATNNTKIYAPFFVQHNDETGPPTSVSNFNTSNTYGVCNWITPWGNIETPVRASSTFPQFVSNFTITVTAADPNIRYAV